MNNWQDFFMTHQSLCTPAKRSDPSTREGKNRGLGTPYFRIALVRKPIVLQKINVFHAPSKVRDFEQVKNGVVHNLGADPRPDPFLSKMSAVFEEY